MFRKLDTVEKVVAELGGTHAVMELTGREGPSVVPVWKHRGLFPGYTYPAIQKALEARGATAPNTLWKLERSRAKR